MSALAPGAVELPEITEAVEKIEAKMEELKPSVIQYEAYQTAIARLTGNTPIRAARGNATTRSTGTPRAPRQTGREDEFVAMVAAEPGKGISYYAEKMNVQPNYLYRVRDKAKGKNRIRMDGSNVFPVTEEDQVAERAQEIAASGK